jgi:hypothetical protein
MLWSHSTIHRLGSFVFHIQIQIGVCIDVAVEKLYRSGSRNYHARDRLTLPKTDNFVCSEVLSYNCQFGTSKRFEAKIAPKTSSILYARWLYEATVSQSPLQVCEYAIRSAWDKQERIGSSMVGGLHRFSDVMNVHWAKSKKLTMPEGELHRRRNV